MTLRLHDQARSAELALRPEQFGELDRRSAEHQALTAAPDPGRRLRRRLERGGERVARRTSPIVSARFV